MSDEKLKIEHRITKLETIQEEIRNELIEIKKQVNNHIPGQISGLSKDFNQSIKEIKKRIESQRNWILGFLVSIILILLKILLNNHGN